METIKVQFVCVGGCVDTVEDEPIAHEVQLAKLRRLRQLRNILIWFFVHFARTD